MTELTIQINNDSIIPSLTKILKSISGVISVTAHKEETKPFLYDPATGHKLNDKTLQLIQHVHEGKEELKSFDSIDALMDDLRS